MTVNFLSFANEKFLQGLKRIERQVIETDIFDQTFCFSNKTKNKIIKDLLSQHEDFISENYDTGFGCWVWKPFLCQRILSELQPNDILVYADSGTEILKESKNELEFFINKVKKNGSLFYAMPFKEKFWTKNIVLTSKYFLSMNNLKNTNQIQATFFILRNDNITKSLVKKWYELCVENDYLFLKDPNRQNEIQAGFKDHRHDQSVLSCMVKKMNLNIYPWDLHIDKSFYFQNSPVLKLAFHPARNPKYESFKINLKKKSFFYYVLKSFIYYIKKNFYLLRGLIEKTNLGVIMIKNLRKLFGRKIEI